MIKIAITGNIASGKSSVENILEEKGYLVYDADKLAHQVLESNSSQIIDAFKGYDISDEGKISRTKLGEVVFNNRELKTRLEGIIYPLLIEIFEQIFVDNCEKEYVFISASQLFEADMEYLFDKKVLVYANDGLRLDRLVSRNGYTQEFAKKRLAAQMRQDTKATLCDYIIQNESDIEVLNQEVDKFLAWLNQA